MPQLQISRPAVWLGGLGLVSGLLSAHTPPPVGSVQLMDVPVYPGLLFGAVIGFGVYRWGRGGWTAGLLALAVSLVAWTAALICFQLVTGGGQTNLPIGGLVAGAVGAGGTVLGGMRSNPSLRRPAVWGPTVCVGAIAGLLVVLEAQQPAKSFLILFAVWQAAVAACIGYGLGLGGARRS